MTLLLTPRVWLALVLAAVFAFSHLTAYRKGKHEVRAEWDAAVAAANTEAHRLEQARQRRADEAAALAAQKEARIRADAAGARRELDGLRDDITAVREHARHSLNACTISLSAAADVFEQCGRRYTDLAEEADRHAADSLRLRQAWPQ